MIRAGFRARFRAIDGRSRRRMALLAGFAIAIAASGCGTRVASDVGADASASRRTIAFLPFENGAITDRSRLEPLAGWLPARVAETMATSGQLEVVERQRLLDVLAEQKLGASELADEATALRVGRLLGAQLLVTGGFVAIGSELRLHARVVDVESGLVVRSVVVPASAADFQAGAGNLASTLAAELGVDVASRLAARGVVGEDALAAAEHYFRGRDHEKAGRIDDAIAAYRAALEIAPDDAAARERLKGLLVAP